jgi:hypothetical protein
VSQSEKALGCWLTNNWAALVAANGIPNEPRLSISVGPFHMNFTLNGLLCMNVWFDLRRDYLDLPSQISASISVDGNYPACNSAPAPDLGKMGGGTFLMVLTTKLNMLRDRVLQGGEGGQGGR